MDGRASHVAIPLFSYGNLRDDRSGKWTLASPCPQEILALDRFFSLSLRQSTLGDWFTGQINASFTQLCFKVSLISYSESYGRSARRTLVRDRVPATLLASGTVSHTEVMWAIELYGTKIAPVVRDEMAANGHR